MQKKKHKQKKYTTDFAKQYPCTKFLNTVYKTNLKPLFNEGTNIYGLFEEQHQKGIETRSKYTYLTLDEIKQVILENTKPYLKDRVAIALDKERLISIGVALSWRRYQKVYAFDKYLLNDLLDVDMEDAKSFCLNKDELQFLPCECFYIEYPVDIKGIQYHGFFVYFDSFNVMDSREQIHIQFITDFSKEGIDPDTGVSPYLNTYDVTLHYAEEVYNVIDESKGTVYTCTFEPFEVLKAKNPVVFKDLGEEEGRKFFTTICQMISYLVASNADVEVYIERVKAIDLQHTNAVTEEIEKYAVGEKYGKAARKKEEEEKKIAYTHYKRVPQEGVRYGQFVFEDEEKEKQSREHYHVRPHLRRGHWKWYWYGKKDGTEQRYRQRKFVSAVFVNTTGEEDAVPDAPSIEKIEYL